MAEAHAAHDDGDAMPAGDAGGMEALLGHRAILAAAGSGKTYQLAMRYLALLRMGADPRSMLATTFTRLAAGEIRDRIVQRLLQMLDDAGAQQALAAFGAEEITRADVAQMLRALVRQMDMLQIRTLDSFFASIVGSFALELQLPIASRITDDDELLPLRREAIARLLNERDPQVFIDLFRRFTQGQVGRSITAAIDGIVAELHVLYRQTTREAWECVPQLPTLKPAELAALIDQLVTVPFPKDKRWETCRAKDIEAALRQDWPALLGSGLVRAVIEGKGRYYNKPLESTVHSIYDGLGQHALGEIINRAREQTLATWELLHMYDQQLAQLKQARGIMTFSDLTLALLDEPRDDSLEELWFRLDGRIDHLLLDEFQDTSTPQWQVLRALAEEITATRPPQRSFFCVGDVKQSIYGWRQGEPGLLLHMNALLPAVGMDTINRTRRSAQTIVDAVNDVFANLSVTRLAEEHAAIVEQWSRGFELHTTVHTEQVGYVELRAVQIDPAAGEAGDDYAAGDEGEGDADGSGDAGTRGKVAARLSEAAALVQRIHERNPSLHIGVLVRGNKAVSELLLRLGPSGAHLPVSAFGGSALIDTEPVNVVLDVLQMADHPADTAAAFHIAATPGRRIVEHLLAGEQDDAADITTLFAREGAALRGRLGERIRAQLLERGYGAVLGEWVALLIPDADAREARRMLQLVELARGYDPRGVHPVADFIALVEKRRMADTQPAPIEIMTFHQSKGLGFDVVIMPELEGRMTGNRPPAVVFERAAGDGPITRICRYMNSQTRAGVPELQPLFDAHMARTIRDSLSVLYVGMTRAKRGLYMLTDQPTRMKSGKPGAPALSMAGVLRQTIGCGVGDGAGEGVDDADGAGVDADAAHGGVLYQRGDESWMDHAIGEMAEVEADDVAAAGLGIPVDSDDGADVDANANADADAEAKARLAGGERVIRFGLPPADQPRALAATPASRLALASRPLAAQLGDVGLGGADADAEFEADRALGESDGGQARRRSSALDHGRAMHALFEQIDWLEDFEHATASAVGDADARLRDVVLRAAPRRDRRWALQRIAQFRGLLGNATVRAVLSRSSRAAEPGAAARIVVHRELPIARLVDGRTQWSVLDRVELIFDREEEALPQRVRIIDYKTDAVDGSGLAGYAEHYRAQMHTYRTAAAELFCVDPGAVTTELLFIAADVLLPIEPL